MCHRMRHQLDHIAITHSSTQLVTQSATGAITPFLTHHLRLREHLGVAQKVNGSLYSLGELSRILWKAIEWHGTFQKHMELSIECHRTLQNMPQNFMELFRIPWNLLELCRNSWNLVEYSMESHRMAWNPIEWHGIPWNINGNPWNGIEHHGNGRNLVEYSRILWNIPSLHVYKEA